MTATSHPAFNYKYGLLLRWLLKLHTCCLDYTLDYFYTASQHILINYIMLLYGKRSPGLYHPMESVLSPSTNPAHMCVCVCMPLEYTLQHITGALLDLFIYLFINSEML